MMQVLTQVKLIPLLKKLTSIPEDYGSGPLFWLRTTDTGQVISK
jgi:hypothetical protein